MVRAFHVPVQREVLFDDHGPTGCGGCGNGDTLRMVGIPHGQAEGGAKRVHGPEIDTVIGAGIAVGAVEQGDVLRPTLPQGFQRQLHIRQRTHAGAQQHRLFLAAHIAQVRNVSDLAGADLDEGDAQRQQKIQTVRFVRRGGELNTDLVAVRFDSAEIVIGKLQPLEHIELGLSAACVVRLIVRLRHAAGDDLLRLPGLELYAVRPGIFCREAKFPGEIEPTVVVDAGLGDDISAHGVTSCIGS